MDVLRSGRGWPSILLSDATDRAATDVGEALEGGGPWPAWRHAVGALNPDEVIRRVTESGLRGRGGAGYPTGDKWRTCADQAPGVRYVVANGFEADPGAQLDRLLIERSPDLVLEGVALAAYAVGANQAFIAVRATAMTASRALREAIAAAHEAGLLGGGALASGHPLEIEVREVQGAHVLGEETVLLRALEDKRAQPDQRPPYPTEEGLWGKPTVVNNVETLAAVPWIVANGPEAFRQAGTPEWPGTTLVQVSGAVKKPGIVEVPMGTKLREIVRIAGGATGTIKAMLVGGPSGGFLPPEELEAPFVPPALESRGAIWGSGSILVIDERACIVDMASLLTRFLNDEACGKTIPCRIGLRRLAEIGERFTSGTPRPTDAVLLADLSSDTRDAALCGLEAAAPNPLLSGMRYFASEFEDHIERGTCPAGVCQPLRIAAGAAQ